MSSLIKNLPSEKEQEYWKAELLKDLVEPTGTGKQSAQCTATWRLTIKHLGCPIHALQLLDE